VWQYLEFCFEVLSSYKSFDGKLLATRYDSTTSNGLNLQLSLTHTTSHNTTPKVDHCRASRSVHISPRLDATSTHHPLLRISLDLAKSSSSPASLSPLILEKRETPLALPGELGSLLHMLVRGFTRSSAPVFVPNTALMHGSQALTGVKAAFGLCESLTMNDWKNQRGNGMGCGKSGDVLGWNTSDSKQLRTNDSGVVFSILQTQPSTACISWPLHREPRQLQQNLNARPQHPPPLLLDQYPHQ
jgi:hypothetical protein